MGRIQDDHLECPYHGWQFGPSGRCAFVPALPSYQPPPSHCARTFQVGEKYGLIWVQVNSPNSEGNAQAKAVAVADDAGNRVEIPAFDSEHDAHLRKLNCGPYDVATSAPRIIENFLDMAHFGFVHTGWLGTREATAIDDYRVETTLTGLRATQCRAWQPQSSLHATAPAQVEYTYEVTAPYSAVLTKLPDPHRLAGSAAAVDYRESIALFICPISAEVSRVWFRLAVADFESSDDKLREFQHTIFMQDQPVLESQTPKRLPLDLRAELHTPADKASSAYRRHLKRLGITIGVC